MNAFIKNLGLILLLLGAACLVVYFLGAQFNILLVLSLVLEVAGVITHIVVNKREK